MPNKSTTDNPGIAVQRELDMAQSQLALYARDLKQTVRDLRASEQRFRGIVERSFDAIVIVDVHGNMAFASPAVARTTGYEPSEIVGRRFTDFISPQSRRAALSAFISVRDGKPIEGVELTIRRKDGSNFIALFNGSPVLEGGKVTGGQVVYQDITARKHAETALQESERKLRAVFDSAQDGILVADAETGRFILSNAGMCRMLGHTGLELLNLGVDDIHPAEHLEFIRQQFKRQTRSEIQLLPDIPVLRKDGSVFYADINASPLTLGGRTCLLGIFHDVTQRRQSEASLRKVNQALHLLSSANESLIRASSETELLQKMCRVVVEVGGYPLTWVGYAQHDAAQTLRVMAQAGRGIRMPDDLALTWADDAHGQHPAGRAIRSGARQVVADIMQDAGLQPWMKDMHRAGIAACIALPLMESGKAFGVICIPAAETHPFGTDEIALLQELADDLAFGIMNLRTRLEHDRLQTEYLHSVERTKEALTETIRAIALTVEKRDPYTAGHQQRVAKLSVAIAKELRLAPQRIYGLQLGAMIHDIGKVYVPAEILNRPGKLSNAEFELIKTHPQVGYDIVKDITFPWPVAKIILQHHERMDGSGYPKGLKGEDIILEARILAVADTVEAISSHRPYRPALGIDKALHEVEAGRGTWYAQDVVDACKRVFEEKHFSFE